MKSLENNLIMANGDLALKKISGRIDETKKKIETLKQQKDEAEKAYNLKKKKD